MISKMFKRNTLLQLLSILDANFAQRKTFESLAIQVKNLLTLWDTEHKNHGYKTQDKKPRNPVRDWGENRELGKVIGDKTSHLKERQKRKTGERDRHQMVPKGNKLGVVIS